MAAGMVIAAAMHTVCPSWWKLMLMQRRGRGHGSRGGIGVVGGLSGGRSPWWPRQSLGPSSLSGCGGGSGLILSLAGAQGQAMPGILHLMVQLMLQMMLQLIAQLIAQLMVQLMVQLLVQLIVQLMSP